MGQEMLSTMMRTVLLAAAALAAMATAADAQHAPTRRKVVESVTIAAPADKVWTVIGNPADATWIVHVTGAERVADAAKPTYRLTLDNGHALVEETRKLDAQARSFAYYLTQNDVADLPANDYSATLSVVPEGEGAARVEWKAAFYRGYPNNDPPPALNDENSEKAVRDWIHASLENLKARLEKGGS